MEHKQTALQFFLTGLVDLEMGKEMSSDKVRKLHDLYDIAKEIEKKQMALFFDKGTGYGICVASVNADDHPYPSYKAVYNEFYETKE